MQKYKKKKTYKSSEINALRVCLERRQKKQLCQMSTRGLVVKSLSAALCGGTVENRQHVASVCVFVCVVE